MKMLDDLVDLLDELEGESDFAFEFVTSIKIQKDENPDKKLSGAQWRVLIQLHDRFVGRRSRAW